MAIYRKKPVLIEAKKFLGTDENVEVLREWTGQNLVWELNGVDDGSEATLIIETLNGKVRAEVGEYIVRGVQGESYPCKSDIFESTHEFVESGHVA